ncbi:hypothetical protein FJ250_11585, partial [bacterium]|nr:hypothetical protein [bacterium]
MPPVWWRGASWRSRARPPSPAWTIPPPSAPRCCARRASGWRRSTRSPPSPRWSRTPTRRRRGARRWPRRAWSSSTCSRRGEAGMRLARVDVRVLPGLEGRFSLEPEPGVNLVVGPNTSGKSSLVRAVGSLLWPAPGGAGQDFLAVTFACRDGLRVAQRRADGALVWTRDGLPASPPRLPDDHLRDRYALGLADLTDARGAGSERAFAAEIRRQMTGGFDLDVTGTQLLRVSTAQMRARLREWQQARLARGERERAHRELRERERALETWRADLAAAENRVRQAEALRAALAVHDARDAVAAAADRLGAFPAALAAFRADDPATLETWRQTLAGANTDVAAHARRLQETQERLRALGAAPPPEAGYPAAVDTLVEAWRQAAVALDTAAAALDGIRSQRQDAIDRLHGAPAE